MSIGKMVSLIKGNKKETIIAAFTVGFIVVVSGIVLSNNNLEYNLKREELSRLGVSSYKNDNLFVKNKTLDNMDTLIFNTEANLNEELVSLLNECTELKLDCVVADDLVLDIKNAKSVLQTKVDEVNRKALDLKLDTSKVLGNQEFTYVTKVSEINKMIDSENKRVASVKKAEEEKKARELAEQQSQAQELAMAETQTQSSTSTSGGSTSTSGGSSDWSSTGSGNSTSSGGSTTTGGSYNCGGTMVVDQQACEELFNNLGEIEQPDYAVCSNPPGGYFCVKDEAYNAGYADPNGVNDMYPNVGSFGMNPVIINNMEMWQVVFLDYSSGYSYDFYGNQID